MNFLLLLGDIVLRYYDRGGKEQEGFMCDQDWSEESAVQVCQHFHHESGIPTYNGQFTQNTYEGPTVPSFKCNGFEGRRFHREFMLT